MKKKVILTFSITLFLSLVSAWIAEDEVEKLFLYSSGISFLIIILSLIFCGKEDKECLNNLRNVSSVILVGLAIFGYFYTVRPTYENKLLEREKKEILYVKDSLQKVSNRLKENIIIQKRDLVKSQYAQVESENKADKLNQTLANVENKFIKIQRDFNELQFNYIRVFKQNFVKSLVDFDYDLILIPNPIENEQMWVENYNRYVLNIIIDEVFRLKRQIKHQIEMDHTTGNIYVKTISNFLDEIELMVNDKSKINFKFDNTILKALYYEIKATCNPDSLSKQIDSIFNNEMPKKAFDTSAFNKLNVEYVKMQNIKQECDKKLEEPRKKFKNEILELIHQGVHYVADLINNLDYKEK